MAGAEVGLPAQTLHFQWSGLWVATLVRFGGGTVGLTEGVSTGDEGDGLFVVHAHAAEGFADIYC